MNSVASANTIEVWTIVLCIAVTFAGLSLGAIFAYAWKRPAEEKPDPLTESRVETRLSQLAQSVHLQPGK